MLARDSITLKIGGRSYTLRPTLQAAIRIEHAFGMAAVLNGISDGSATIMATVIRDTADMDWRLADILDDLCAPTMAVNMVALREPLAGLVLSMYGLDDDKAQAATPKPGAKMIPASDHLAQLYRYATGWLGWAPAVALGATPAEITEAMHGHVDMLKAIHGAKDEPEPVDLDTKARAIFGGLAQRFRDRQAAKAA